MAKVIVKEIIPCRECGKFNVAKLPYDGVHCGRCFDAIQQASGGVYGLKTGPSRRFMSNILSRFVRLTEMSIAMANDSVRTHPPPCQYGAKCYRKNPDHFATYSHPHLSNDPDWLPGDP